ncbi:MAG: hypothetical protein JJLCMIEE_02183 [Acidimicrobiales bacterium]|nr:MAG: hypothetical protein EDR02_08135 [Actinomycetota bacterium]MBV6509115.1 hypothetical protein [Acidimicrobiales bacterium]RIK08530.1 MAG: hypothetical protein DCC48_00870 [Acidobacteriota bacterium]
MHAVMVGAASLLVAATVPSAGAGVPDSSSTIAPPPSDPPSTTSVYQPPSTTAYQAPITTTTYYSPPTSGSYQGSDSATTSPPDTSGAETEEPTTTSRPPSTTSPTIAPASGETEVDVVDGQDISDTNDTAQRTITYVIAGLIGLALVIGFLTFLYWRMTRPAPLIAGDDTEPGDDGDDAAPADTSLAIRPVPDARPSEEVSVGATADTAPVPVPGRNGGDADGGSSFPESEIGAEAANSEEGYPPSEGNTSPVDEPTQAVETID